MNKGPCAIANLILASYLKMMKMNCVGTAKFILRLCEHDDGKRERKFVCDKNAVIYSIQV